MVSSDDDKTNLRRTERKRNVKKRADYDGASFSVKKRMEAKRKKKEPAQQGTGANKLQRGRVAVEIKVEAPEVGNDYTAFHRNNIQVGQANGRIPFGGEDDTPRRVQRAFQPIAERILPEQTPNPLEVAKNVIMNSHSNSIEFKEVKEYLAEMNGLITHKEAFTKAESVYNVLVSSLPNEYKEAIEQLPALKCQYNLHLQQPLPIKPTEEQDWEEYANALQEFAEQGKSIINKINSNKETIEWLNGRYNITELEGRIAHAQGIMKDSMDQIEEYKEKITDKEELLANRGVLARHL